MLYRKLGNTDVEVSLICLGTMTWGEQNSESEAHEQLDYAVSRGVNFFDTAEVYPVPPKAETQGHTEAIIGTWLKKRKDRDRFIIATKVCPRSEWTTYIREGKNCLDRENIEAALDGSLQRLQTDYIDLYQLHWPERDTNFFGKLGYYHAPDKDGIPIAETLQALDAMIKTGKIRHVGISNETPWGIAEYLRLSLQENLPGIVTIQNPYNLLNRTFEIGCAEFSHRENVGLLAYSPMAFGVLSGKYLDDNKPEGARLTLSDRFTRYTSEQAVKSTRAYVDLAMANGLDPAQMALAFVNSRPFLSSTIIGATTMEQLKTNIGSLDVQLPKDLIRAIEDIHNMYPNPCP